MTETDDNLIVDGTVQIKDNTPPATTVTVSGVEGDNGWFTSDVTVSLSATDDVSGVNVTEYSFDEATWTVYSTPFLVTDGLPRLKSRILNVSCMHVSYAGCTTFFWVRARERKYFLPCPLLDSIISTFCRNMALWEGI